MSQASKTELISRIVTSLEARHRNHRQGAGSRGSRRRHSEESAAENKYGTFGLESGYLAASLSRRVREIEQSLQAYYRDLASIWQR
jgi:hypothetical protein